MIGQKLAHYQITAHLGSGGMGEVYRARDTKLGRDVAVKVLPGTFAANVERLARFEQEARTLAALNHPNIMAIFDTGVHNGSSYLVSELLEGQTLRDALKTGAMPLRRTLEYAVQIAHGLAAAHEKGIIHRDLKPENIFITRDNRVKILDFGLAKLAQVTNASGDSPTLAPSAQTPAPMTEPGMVLGTPGYMSPEQAHGHAAEERSDIFSFGIVLYEMLCGQRAFAGDTAIEVMHAIIKSEPRDLAERVENLPPTLDRVVRRCMEKRPEQRFQTASDLAFALENSISSDTSMLRSQHLKARWRPSVGRLLPWAIALIALAAAGYGFISARRDRPLASGPVAPAGPLRKIELTLPPAVRGLILAPDGKKLLYLNAEGVWMRWLDRVAPPVLLVAQRSLQQLNATIQHPFWSPQSSDVGYFQGAELKRVSINGGNPRKICDMVTAALDTAGGAWLSDDHIVFSTGNSGLYEVPATGGTPALALAPGEDEQAFYRVRAIPGTRSIVFVVHRRSASPGWDTIAVWSAPGPRKILLQTPGAPMGFCCYASSGFIIYSSRTSAPGIWAFPYSAEKMERTGEPFLVASGAMYPSVSEDGTLAYSPVSASPLRQLVWVDRSGKVAETIGSPMPGLSGPHLSTDGKRIVALADVAPSNNSDVWVFDVASGNAIPMTHTPSPEGDPFWSPDGRRVMYSSLVGNSSGGRTVREKLVDGFEDEKEVLVGSLRSFSRSGKYMFVRTLAADVPGAPPELARSATWAYADLSPGSDRKLRLLPNGFNASDVALSPDDQSLAYSSSESGRIEVYLVSFPDFKNKQRVSRDGGQRMQWNTSGSELFFLAADRRELWSAVIKRDADAQDGEQAKICDLPKSINLDPLDPTRNRFQVAADGQRFLMVQNVNTNGEEADKQAQQSSAILVQNWQDEFREKK